MTELEDRGKRHTLKEEIALRMNEDILTISTLYSSLFTSSSQTVIFQE